MLLLIDNYDSFTFNLVHALETLRPAMEVRVVRNDAISAKEAEALAPAYLVISPGPCTPKESGVSRELISLFRGRIPILGVCLGHQAIGECYGMTVRRNERVVHGKTWAIHHDGRGIYAGLPNPFTATRYHSLIVDRATVGSDFEVSAWTAEGEVMGLRWKGAAARGDGARGAAASDEPSDRGATGRGEAPGPAPLDGVQFHPESFLTVDGPKLLENFLQSGRAGARPRAHA